jgi:hypothetical protein
VVNAGVELFAAVFPQQTAEGQIQSLASLSSHVRSSKLERNPGRKQAVVANTMAALNRSLRNMDGAGVKARKALGSAQVTDLVKSLLQVCHCSSTSNTTDGDRMLCLIPALVYVKLQQNQWVL